MRRLNRRSATRPVVVLAAALTVVGVAGCTISPVVNRAATQISYDPSDGVGGEVGGVLARNMLLIGGEEEGPAQLIGVLVNDTLEEATATVTGPGGLDLEVVVPARSSVPVGEGETVDAEELTDLPEGASIEGSSLADPVGAVPGSLVPVEVAADGLAVELSVPLLDGTLPEYQTLVPTGSPTQEPTPTGTPSPTGQPTGDESPAPTETS